MDKIIAFFSSTRLMAVLFVVFAAAMGIGTFIEDAYNTETARVFIYNTKWFEAIMVIFVINFFGNIKRYQLHKKEKWATLLLHLSFILIILGAFVTRYISYEGMMPIREGATESHFYSDKPYLTVLVDGEYQGGMSRLSFEKPILMSSKEFPLFANNHFTLANSFNKIPFEVEYKDFILGAKDTIVPDANGDEYIKLVEQTTGQRREHYLKSGEVQNISNILFAFNKQTAGAVNVSKSGDEYTFNAPFEGNYMRMADRFQGAVAKDSVQPLMFRSLYNMAGAMFVFPEPAIKGKQVYRSNGDFKTKEESALVVTVKSGGQEKEVTLLGGKGQIGMPVAIKLGELDFTLMYGSKTYELPFKIQLNDFIGNRYPGMEGQAAGFSSFESKVSVIDDEKKDKFDYHIYMNHVMDYRGYRFFQSGFDEDEKGTKLSVSHDFWGTWLSYIGYFLLYIGLMAILFDKNTRFKDLERKLNKIKEKKKAMAAAVMLLVAFSGYSQDDHTHTTHTKPSEGEIETMLERTKVSPEHAARFGKLVAQDGGRMVPMNTMASEILRKLSKKDTFKGMNAEQAFISMSLLQEAWVDVPVIALPRGNGSIRKVAGLPLDTKFAAMSDFFDAQGNYKLSAVLEEGAHKREMNKFDTDFKLLNEQIVLLNLTLSGQMFNVMPIPNDKGHKWVSYAQIMGDSIKGMDTIRNIIPYYWESVAKALQDKDYSTAEKVLTGLENYQKKFGAEVMPAEAKIDAEIRYNKMHIFERLYQCYALFGILMMAFVIVNIFNKKKWVGITVKVFHVLIGIMFVLHTLGLAMRWYISGHAPWSDAYESIVYVGWATMFFGLAFGRKSQLTVAATAFVAAIVLWVAHLNFTDPGIANLQPVLNSYWLMIHVAVIVACYGPFTLGFILGLLSLFLMIFTNSKNKAKMDINIKEITYINEMALTVGLVMLAIGNFLGGQWANESWGRYWGWDPKETWAMVSIMVYAFVIHMRFVPALRGTWIFNFFSVFAFASILMTYFGVNFYLTGLHSYASGEMRTPAYFYYMALGGIIIGTLANIQYRKHLKKK
ncbi:cytochrome C biogenesis protein [Flavobacterium akiainvivens]|uniref:Cytochrome C biogenesis protein n=1 Tax=Flavobacterium akiainvivens TaxID=1202724 RepID=A0A0M9VHI0_9FLAO|nr:cytochrome c biogenesis protein CcsA [Flavobacterium akiainvivens]KOS05332.1 cytochrome C biogenesis protein [Flavobacterium akiainvivens]SFQ76638.1 cytochrome c-type biogenesis protein CcsB [Flavobacterium akiainvivens]